MARHLSVRAQVRKRAADHCEICGEKFVTRKGNKNASMHHRFMRRHGGIDGVTNLIHICLSCHRAIHKNAVSERHAGFMGWISWTIPEVTPLWLHREYWVLLTADGGYEQITEEEAVEMLDWLATFEPVATDPAEVVAEVA